MTPNPPTDRQLAARASTTGEDGRTLYATWYPVIGGELERCWIARTDAPGSFDVWRYHLLRPNGPPIMATVGLTEARRLAPWAFDRDSEKGVQK